MGIVGVSSQPTSGIALITLLGIASLFAAAGWTDIKSQAAVLTVGTIVAIAASKSGDISQDLKTGFLVGAMPAKQQLGQLLARPLPAGRSPRRCCCWAKSTNLAEGASRAASHAHENYRRGRVFRPSSLAARF